MASFSNESLEYTACPLCGADQFNKNKVFNFEPFRVVQCTNCQLWYLSPRLREADMLKIYADPSYFEGNGEFGYSQQQGSYLDQEKALRITFRKLMRRLKRQNLTGGHLLEIGCGYGFLLEEAEPYFQTVTGTDFDSESIHRIKQLDFQGFRGGVDSLPDSKSYDLIIATGVIEHIYNPIEFITQLRQYLNTDGWILLATPQMNSFWLKLQGKHWPSFKIPEHVTYYDYSTLTELFKRCQATQMIQLSYPHAYPLGMISQKLGLPLPAWLSQYHIWLPNTMFAIAGCFES